METSDTVPEPVIVYLGLGSNMGDRFRNLREALRLLKARMDIEQVSPVYETAPVGNTKQPRFLNMACSGITSRAPHDLLDFIKEIERRMGRRSGPVNSPRPIDIDILFYDETILDSADLKIPHPRLVERAFVLEPLSDIAPQLRHPVVGKTVKELRDMLPREPGDAVRWGEK